MSEIPIIPAKDVPSLEKSIFLSVIADIERTETLVEQKIAAFDIMIEGFKTVFYLIYEFEKTLEIDISKDDSKEKISDIDKEYKIASFLYGLNDTILKFDKLLDYSGYEKTRDSKLLDTAIESAKLTYICRSRRGMGESLELE